MKNARPVVLALLSALTAFVLAVVFERALIRLLGLDLRELEWLSDLLLAAAFGVATFLWLHLRRARTALDRLERARIAFETELSIATDIQQGLLPSPPPAQDGWRFAALLEPAGRIGGDFYDFVDRGRSLLVLLADVSGKGIPAAIVMSSVQTLFRHLARETDRPDELFEALGRALWEEHGGSPYLTGFLARLDLESHEMSWVNAGHPAGLLVGGSGHRALRATGPPAGLLPCARYEVEALRMAEGDALVLVTDGITDAIAADGEVDQRLLSGIRDRKGMGPEVVCERLMQLARSGPGPLAAGDWQDDRTVVAITLEARP